MSKAQRMTQAELVEQMTERFGPDHHAWAFICPRCGDVASFQDFIDAGADPQKCGQECIGRSLGVLKRDQPPGGYRGRGCDWCAYGLFRGPIAYVMPDGHEAWGFRVAPTPSEAP